MKRLDLITEAIRLAEYHVKAKGWGDDIDLELYTEALAAARSLRELKPVVYLGKTGLLFNNTTHLHLHTAIYELGLHTALYALDEVTK